MLFQSLTHFDGGRELPIDGPVMMTMQITIKRLMTKSAALRISLVDCGFGCLDDLGELTTSDALIQSFNRLNAMIRCPIEHPQIFAHGILCAGVMEASMACPRARARSAR